MDLIYFSPVSWNSIAQRPHFFIKEAIKRGFSNIIWVNPTPSRFPETSDFRRVLSPFEANSFDIPPQVSVISPKLIPIEPFNSAYKILNKKKIDLIVSQIESKMKHTSRHLIISKPSLLAESVLLDVKFTSTTMDLMDDFPCFFSGFSKVSVNNILRRILLEVDFCIYSSTNLCKKYSLKKTNSMLVLNACDDDFLLKVKSMRKKQPTNNLVFGYVGTVANWFDWDAILKLSSQYPDAEIQIVGPRYSSPSISLPKNIKILPAIDHSSIPEVISGFDYGLIPFKKNELTDSVDPVKYYEYLANDIPVITTSFGQMESRINHGNVHSFSTFSTDFKIKPESTVTWSGRLQPFFDLINV